MSRRPTRPAPSHRRNLARRPRLERLESRELLIGYTVTTVADSGVGSLRAAILAADNDMTLGGDSISFQIPGSGVQTINLASALPAITRTVVIDGTTQPGFSASKPSPVVVLNGSGAGAQANGLQFTAGTGSVVRGLSVVGFSTGTGILLGGSSANTTIEGDYLGVLPSGVQASPNANGLVINTAGNVIGSPGPANLNLISGNSGSGILIAGPSATHNLVSGNLIGTDVSGFFGVGNTYGIDLAGSGNTIGGTTAGAGNVISGNVGPGGTTGAGIVLQGISTGNLIEGNQIGTDASGGTAGGTGTVQNVFGIYVGTPGGSSFDSVSGDTIGGTVAGAGNTFAGNFIGITGNGLTGGLIAGNTFGLGLSGRVIPNGDGILLGANTTTIGGTTAAARNVISGSNIATGAVGNGLDLTGDSDLIQGNYVGLTPSGLGLTGTGNVNGMVLHLTNSTIGGTASGAGNVVANNLGDAIILDNNGGDLIQGNILGRSPSSPTVITNGGSGILVNLTPPSGTGTAPPLALNDTIGGSAAGAGNTITGSFGGSGIVVHNSYPGVVTGLGIRGNSIYGNANIGIDLVGNNLPVPGYVFVTSANPAGGNITVSGIVHGLPSTSYAIDLFGNAANAPVDPSGFGPGQFYLGSVTATTDGTGFATFSPTFAAPSASLVAFSATSTGPDGNTSEFSSNFPPSAAIPTADLAVTSTASSATATVGGQVTFTETITNTGPAAASRVVLNDSLPSTLVNTTVVAGQGTASIDGNNVVTAQIGTLAPGQSTTVTITGIASQQGALADKVGVASTTLDPNFANNEAQATVTVNPASGGTGADLAITKVASPSTATVGSTITYIVTVTNLGPATATNATVNDFLPSGVTIVGATPGQGGAATISGTLVTDNLGTLASGASATLTVVVTPTAAGTITNAANVSGNQFDPVPGNNSTSVTTTVTTGTVTPGVGLLLSASVNPAVGAIGQIQLFTLTLTNTGTSPATNATIINALPANSVFLLAGPTQGGPATVANNVVTDDLGTIAPGASATLIIVVVPTAPGPFVNFAGAFTPDDLAVTPSFAFGAVFVPAPPLGPSSIGLAGMGNNSQLVIPFNEPMDPISARNANNYVLTATGPRGGNRQIRIAAVTYNQLSNSAVIVPEVPLDPTLTYRLVLIGTPPTGLVDAMGRPLVGTPGKGGTNAIIDFYAGALPQI